ncbi:MAG: hypothetical protein ACI398_09915, partial [Clostridium sp.]
MNFLYYRKNKKDYFKINFKFKADNDIIVKKFNIDRDFTYLNLRFIPRGNKNPLTQLMLIDPHNILRLQYRSVNSKKNLAVGKESDKCSIGAYPGTINSGEWKLIIINIDKNRKKLKYNVIIEASDKLINEDIDKIGDEIWVDYSKEEKDLLSLSCYDWDKCFSKESRWYKGDFHTHTILSDGKMDNELYIDTAKKMNMDFAV